jgi:preprotein translocase subunit YajC
VQDLAALLPFLAIALIFWLLLIRPQQRRAKQLQSMQQALDVGDEVMLTSGVLGTLTSVDDETIGLEIAPGVTIRVARGAVGRRIEEPRTEEPRTEEPRTDEPGERPTPSPEEN